MGNPENSIVNPPAFKGFEQKTVLYIPADSSTRVIEKAVQERAEKDRELPMGHLYGLRRAVVLYSCIGAPAAVLALESLISGGAEEIILLGFCGSLCRRARLLDAVIVTEALSDEGTSQHYFPERKEFVPSPDLTESLEQTIRSQGLPLLPGAVVSTDAPYRETPSWRDRWLDSGADGVDMETSAVFALAEFRGIRAASLLIVSDELNELGHNRAFNHPRMPEILQEYFLPFIRERAE